MARIENISLKGQKLSFKDIKIAFDMKGISEDIDSKYAQELANLGGFKLVGEKKSSKKEVKEEKKEKSIEKDDLTVAEIKKILDEKEIEYPARANKDELLKLL